MSPDFSIETSFLAPVAGIDEAGRGPWAGPVVAAAVILDPDNIPAGLNDSKKLSAKRREALYDPIMLSATVGVGEASVGEIDAMNILEATMLAMRRASANLALLPAHVLVDGNRDPGLHIPTTCMVKGDARSLSIAAASIIAKVTRDRIMAELSQDWPAYGWAQNAGYGVAHHATALSLVGISPHHRRSFAPIKKILLKDSAINP
jgi:ribonuclease HII